jgi:hypothetical protein
MTSVIINDYSAYSFVVYGDTKIHKDKLKELGGRYNGKLSVGPGWVFSLDKKDVVQEWYDNLKLNADIVDSRDKIIEELKKENAELKKKLDDVMSDLGYDPSQLLPYRK